MNDSMENVETAEDLESEAQKFLEELDIEHFCDRLEGRDGGLRPSKPKAQSDTGLEQYIWRMARFHSGDDPKMPVTAQWDLTRFLEDESEQDYSGIMKESGIGDGKTMDTRSTGFKQIEQIADVISRVCVAKMGGNPDGGIERWQKALYGN